MNDSIRGMRLWSGVVLFAYVASHLVNHTLGLVSISVMEGGRAVFLAIWRNPVGTIALYGALSMHVILTLWALYARRSLRMHRWELTQLLLGLSIPPMLAQHIIGTRVVNELFGIDTGYFYTLLTFTQFSPWLGVQQIVLLALAWVHGCIGLHFWLRLKKWYPAAQMWLFAAALLIPTFAIFGFWHAAAELDVLLRAPGKLKEILTAIGLPNDRALVFYNRLLGFAWTLMAGMLAVVFVARAARSLVLRRRGLVRIVYPGAQIVDVAKGHTVLEASRIGGVPHASVCGGRGRCSTCRIRIGRHEAPLPEAKEDERKVLSRVGAAPNVRLACQLRPNAGRIEVTPLLAPTATARDAYERPGYLEGREEEIAVLFADLRAFTELSEKKLPFDVVFMLNRYFSAMGEAVEDVGGHLDKFIGDGVMALFGVGTDRRTGCRQALAAARAMGEKLEELNRALKNELDAPLRIGIGIHAGPAIVGEMGYGQAVNLTAVGDTVNTASRLETLTKTYNSQLVVSQRVADYAEIDLSNLPLEEIAIRGRQQALSIRVAEWTELLPVTGVRAERRLNQQQAGR
ncbi:MAG TPA: adenylate/guanylate cyclase domain-containing protein [Alphaproteobacteria bacterium]|nr:adenylate/guanylate cyclase domain-containing protein [Alphaproteobacteria bacterium]